MQPSFSAAHRREPGIVDIGAQRQVIAMLLDDTIGKMMVWFS